jgi:hypothetical protein
MTRRRRQLEQHSQSVRKKIFLRFLRKSIEKGRIGIPIAPLLARQMLFEIVNENAGKFFRILTFGLGFISGLR